MILLLIVFVLFTFLGCAGDDGSTGPAGTSTGTVAGTVTNSISSSAVAEADIETDPDVAGATQTDSSGAYSLTLPTGVYEITFSRNNFTSQTVTVSIIAGETTTEDISLVPTGAVVVNAGSDETADPGSTVSLSSTVEVLNGSTATPTYIWTQTAGVTATITGSTSASPTITLGSSAAYKAAVFEHSESYYGIDSDTGDPVMENHERFMLQPITPLALEEAEVATFKVTVTVGSTSYSDTVNITAELPYVINPGVRDVPIGLTVLLHGKTQETYDWSITGPSGSTATLDSSSVQNPAFTPDVQGRYVATEATSGASIEVYAGKWVGVITGIGADSRPDADSGCLGCHNGTDAPDKFTPWRDSGHAEILTNNITDPAGHWSPSGCGPCHSVGYNPNANNDGFDDLAAAQGWTFEHGSTSAWTDMVANYDETARRANIQCENCHGPQDTGNIDFAHKQGSPRTDMSSDVCGSCHGEPARHARFQQWAESGHGNYELAIGEGMSTSCARCHSAQGFLIYLAQLEAGDTGSLSSADITWDEDSVHPQTCTTCHDPHAQGKTSGEPNTATVRVEDNTPLLPSGFMATGVGRGAVCIVCHNSRNGERNDTAMPTADDRAPHTAAQGDVLMGKNSYFVSGERSPHSLIADTCTTCHMELTPPPAALSYNLSGTNHTFAASLNICTECHGTFDGGSLTDVVGELEEELKTAIETAVMSEMNDILTTTDIVLFAGETDEATIATGSTVSDVDFAESHGRLAISFTVTDAADVATEYTHVRLGSDTQIGAGPDSFITSANGQVIAKAGWNFFLIEGDGSKGIHNPGFAMEVLETTIATLNAL